MGFKESKAQIRLEICIEMVHINAYENDTRSA